MYSSGITEVLLAVGPGPGESRGIILLVSLRDPRPETASLGTIISFNFSLTDTGSGTEMRVRGDLLE